MEKWLCWSAMGISGIMMVIFLLDLLTGFPFSGVSKALDIFAIIAAAIIAYLAFDTYREIK